MTLSTKDKLAWTAAKLFQEKGYNGVGLTEILTTAGTPKGSLYHHFPNGKADLALEAAEVIGVRLGRRTTAGGEQQRGDAERAT